MADNAWSRIKHMVKLGLAKAKQLKAWFDGTRPGRTQQRFAKQNGNVLAGGIAYYSLTSVAAGLVLAVTVASAVIGSNDRYRSAVFDFLAQAVPGVISTSNSRGIVDPDSLRPSPVTGVVGLVALLVLLNTASRYLAGMRAAERTMLGREASSPIYGKLRDFGALIAIALVVIIGAVLQVGASRAAGAISGAIGEGGVPDWVVWTSSAGVGFVVDSAFVAIVMIVLGRARFRPQVVLPVIAVTALAIGILRQASSLLVGTAVDNPVLAPFAAVITLLIFVDLVARVLLLSGAWLGAATTPDDEGDPDDRGATADRGAAAAQGDTDG